MFTKLVKEHQQLPRFQSSQADGHFSSFAGELIVISLELVKNRLGAFNSEMRRSFMTNVFTNLVDKTPDVRVMKALLKIFEDWIKYQPLSSQGRVGGAHQPLGLFLREKV